MNIKVKTLNPDGSVAFEGEFGPNEVQYLLEVGTNWLLQKGALAIMEEEEEEDVVEESPVLPVAGNDTVQ